MRKFRDTGHLKRGHRDHHVIGLEAPFARVHDVPHAVAPQAIDLDASAHRQIEVPSVGLQVVRHLIFRRKAEGGGGKWQPDKPVVLSRCEQAQ